MPQADNSVPNVGDVAQAKRAFFRNTYFSIGHQVLTVGLVFLLVPFMLWRLGVESYGLWLTLQIFNVYGLISLAELGLQGAITRHLVRYRTTDNPEAFKRLFVTGLGLFAVIGLLCTCAVLAFAFTGFVSAFRIPSEMEAQMRAALAVYGLGLSFAFPAMVLKSYFGGFQNVAVQKVWEMADRSLFAVAAVTVLMLSESLLLLAIVEQAIGFVLFLVFMARARRMGGKPWFTLSPAKISRRALDGVLSLSGLVFLNGISNMVYVRVPEILVSIFLGPVSLTYYALVVRIPRLMKTLQGALNAAVLPFAAMLDSDSDNRSSKRNFAISGLRVSFLFFVPVACTIAVFAPEILRLWVGNEFVWLAPLVVLFAASQLMSIVVAFGSATFTSNDQYRRLVWPNLIVNAAFVGVTSFMLPEVGLKGLFVILLGSSASTLAIAIWATSRANYFRVGEFFRQVALGPVLLSGLTGLTLLAVGRSALYQFGILAGLGISAALGLAYAVIIYVVVLNRQERLRLKQVAGRVRKP